MGIPRAFVVQVAGGWHYLSDQPFRMHDFTAGTLLIPFFLTCLSVVAQFVHGVVSLRRKAADVQYQQAPDTEQSKTFLDFIRAQVTYHGGFSIYCFAVARLFGCLGLLGLSLTVALSTKTHGNDWRGLTSPLSRNPELFMAIVYLYCSALALISVSAMKWSQYATSYNIVILFSALIVYYYRDIWPLATFTIEPQDKSEGILLWIRIGVLTFTAVLIPLFVPRRYVPVDSKDPMLVPNDEQTCSLFSLVVYSYLDPVIILSNKVAHLKSDQLPPLCDTDYATNLKRTAFPHLDTFAGAKREHLFFGLMRVFRKEYTISAALIIIQVSFTFLSPVGINQLLKYLETRGENAFIRPWFWIFCISISPVLRTLCFQWYSFINTRALVRAEGLLTQLVFEHSFRIRFKAEGSGEVQSMSPHVSARSSGADSEGNEFQSEPTAVKTSRPPSSSSQDSANRKKNNGQSQIPKEKKGADNLIGKINNLLTTDVTNILEARDFLVIVLWVPYQVALCIGFLYLWLGWSAFIGLAVLLLGSSVPGYTAKELQRVQVLMMKKTDARVQEVVEALNVLRMIKMFGWESQVNERIKDKREEELALIWRFKLLKIVMAILNYIIPLIAMLATFGTYTVIMKQELTPSKIFSSTSVFSLLRVQLQRLAERLSRTVQGKVSLDRLTDFLRNTELLDVPMITHSPDLAQVIGFKNASFTWSQDSLSGSSTRPFILKVEGEVRFQQKCINLIVGPTGSGKTSALMALLGEMHYIPSGSDSWYSLPRNDGIAYASQESWVQNATIRANILFGEQYDEVRYRKVLKQCALERDLESFDAGDNTEVGEKGITLSGGQKARITLARAIYSSAKTILLDDVLAALDVHTATWIVNKCLRGDLIKERTIILVTHNVALVAPLAGFVAAVAMDGTIRPQGRDYIDQHDNASVVSEADTVEAEEVGTNQQAVVAHGSSDGKLVIKEDILEGRVKWKSFKMFIFGMGGTYPWIFFSVVFTCMTLNTWINAFQVWFLGYWGSHYENRPASEVHASWYLLQYSLVLLVALSLFALSFILFFLGSVKASRVVNTSLIDSILRSTLRWLDETPNARMITRCTQDMRAVDDSIPQAFYNVVELGLDILTKLVVIVSFSPVFLLPSIAVTFLGFYLGNMYLKAQLSVKRELSNARAPLVAHTSAAISGIVSIRAYGAQSAFKTESLVRIDYYVRIARITYNLNRWLSSRHEAVGAIYAGALAAYLVYGRHIGSANTGFSLNLAVDFCLLNLWWIRSFNEFEVQSNSLERIQGYLDIDHEPDPIPAGEPPAAWPISGHLKVENLTARYSKISPEVLHDLSFVIKSGERVGLVGRTGSGKSSLALALLRCIITEGSVSFDGIDTKKINLASLRSNVTIIPQTPELLSGTLRHNLDPFEEHDDATLNDALRDAGLFSLQEELGEVRLTLDGQVAAAGGNLSVGQRQIIALARAMVRRSRLLILDEATSAIDYKTDAVIQKTLRRQLDSDVTVITIAHRLQTIMDADKIMVLDSGRIVEFDNPKVLLANQAGFFRSLVDQSGDKDTLYALAEGGVATTS